MSSTWALALHGGAGAIAQRVLQRTSKSGWLHFSCHGLFNPMFPSQSVLQMADGQLSAARLLRGSSDAVVSFSV